MTRKEWEEIRQKYQMEYDHLKKIADTMERIVRDTESLVEITFLPEVYLRNANSQYNHLKNAFVL